MGTIKYDNTDYAVCISVCVCLQLSARLSHSNHRILSCGQGHARQTIMGTC